MPYRINTIGDFHRFYGLPKPEHPLISVIDFAKIGTRQKIEQTRRLLNFYSIAIKRTSNYILKYGQQEYDFDSGVMYFMGPGQILNVTAEDDSSPKMHRMAIAYPS